MASIISLNVGKPINFERNEKTIQTGIFKQPINHSVYLSKTNLNGDAQADLVHHGGVEKAVCVYPFEHYKYWEELFHFSLTPGAFGENITSMGTLEGEVHIGDIYEFGETILQVSQPRQPCFKLSQKFGIKKLPLLFQQTGFTGFYFRVMKEGIVSKESTFKLIENDQNFVTVDFANRIMHQRKDDLRGIQTILNVKALSINWRNTLENRLHGIITDDTLRLKGLK